MYNVRIPFYAVGRLHVDAAPNELITTEPRGYWTDDVFYDDDVSAAISHAQRRSCSGFREKLGPNV